MHVLAGHQADRVLPVRTEFVHDSYHADAAAFGGAGQVVELNVFKKTLDEDLLPVSVARNGQSADLTASKLEEIQQARFREARRLKRVEALELEIRLARAQNEALRVALETAVEATRRVALETTTDGAGAPDPTPQCEPSEEPAAHVPVLRLGRFLAGLRRNRR